MRSPVGRRLASTPRAVVGNVARGRALPAFAALLVALACTQRVTRYYIPSPGNPRFTPAQAEGELATFLAVRCGERGDSALARRNGGATVAIEVGNVGLAPRAEVKRGTGDGSLDALFGTVAAQLALAPPTRVEQRSRSAEISFACDDSSSRPVRVEVR
jgi:hypothetical protein